MDHIIDLALPAHDPTFPKPRGLLPVPPEVAQSIADYEAECIRKHGTGYSPEARRRILDANVLSWHCDGLVRRPPPHAPGRRGPGGGLGGGT